MSDRRPFQKKISCFDRKNKKTLAKYDIIC